MRTQHSHLHRIFVSLKNFFFQRRLVKMECHVRSGLLVLSLSFTMTGEIVYTGTLLWSSKVVASFSSQKFEALRLSAWTRPSTSLGLSPHPLVWQWRVGGSEWFSVCVLLTVNILQNLAHGLCSLTFFSHTGATVCKINYNYPTSCPRSCKWAIRVFFFFKFIFSFCHSLKHKWKFSRGFQVFIRIWCVLGSVSLL